MKRTYALLVVVSLPIIALAQLCMAWRPFDIQDVDRSEDQRVFGAVAPMGVHSYWRDKWEIRQWSPDLSECKTIHRLTANLEHIAVNDPGTMVAVQGRDMVMAIEPDSGEVFWQSTIGAYPVTAKLFFSKEDRYLIAVNGFNTGNDQLSVIDVHDGSFVGSHLATGIRKVYTSGDIITILDSNEILTALQVIDGGLVPIDDQDVANKQDFQEHLILTRRYGDRSPLRLDPREDTEIRLLYRSEQNAATIEVLSTENQSVLHRYQATWAEQTVASWRLLAGLMASVWVLALSSCGQRSENAGRVLLDLALAVGLLLAVCVNFTSAAQQDNHSDLVKSLTITITTLFSLLFWALLYNRRKFYAFIAGFFACAVSAIAPCILCALLLRWRGFGIRWNDKPLCGSADTADPNERERPSRFRFGISEMLLFTLYAAVFIGVGIHFIVAIPFGFVLAGLLMVGCVLGLNLVIARITCCLCVFGLVLLGCRWTRYPHLAYLIPLLMILFVFAFLRCYGFRISRLAKTQAEIEESPATATSLAAE